MHTPTLSAEFHDKLNHAFLNANRSPVKTRRLNRHKVVGDYLFQLHATRGWKPVGRVKK